MALAYAILAALSERSCSGYDLAKLFDGSVGFFWKATHQQIYRELTKLEAQGWLESETIRQEGRPDKKLYTATNVGQQALQRWIAQPGEASPIKDELLVKLFAGYLVPDPTLIAELERHQAVHQARLTTYYQIEQQHFAQPETLSRPERLRHLTLQAGIHYEKDWLAWCAEAIATLKELAQTASRY